MPHHRILPRLRVITPHEGHLLKSAPDVPVRQPLPAQGEAPRNRVSVLVVVVIARLRLWPGAGRGGPAAAFSPRRRPTTLRPGAAGGSLGHQAGHGQRLTPRQRGVFFFIRGSLHGGKDTAPRGVFTGQDPHVFPARHELMKTSPALVQVLLQHRLALLHPRQLHLKAPRRLRAQRRAHPVHLARQQRIPEPKGHEHLDAVESFPPPHARVLGLHHAQLELHGSNDDGARRESLLHQLTLRVLRQHLLLHPPLLHLSLLAHPPHVHHHHYDVGRSRRHRRRVAHHHHPGRRLPGLCPPRRDYVLPRLDHLRVPRVGPHADEPVRHLDEVRVVGLAGVDDDFILGVDFRLHQLAKHRVFSVGGEEIQPDVGEVLRGGHEVAV